MTSTKPTAFVTGTSTGFGHLIALDLAAAGYAVFATMRNTATKNAAPKAALEAKGITVLDVELTDDASVEAAARTALAGGPIDVIVNNAGSAFMGIAEAFTPEAIARQFDANVLSTVRVNRALLPAMRGAKRGLVIYVSSVVGRMIIPFIGVYTASKWAMGALAESTSYELRPFGIDVAIVEPGAYGTNITNTMIGADDTARVASYGDVAKIFDQIGANLSSGAGNAQEVADAVLALVEAPAGERPLRTVVGTNDAVRAINAAAPPYQRAILESSGLAQLLPKEPTPA